MRAEELDAIYAEVPKLDCRLLCQESCGPFVPHVAERERLVTARVPGANRVPLWALDTLMCTLLLKNGRCSCHTIRPMICRLWGVVEGMPCPWGCVPERYLTKEEGWALMKRIHDLTGETPRDELAILEATLKRAKG